MLVLLDGIWRNDVFHLSTTPCSGTALLTTIWEPAASPWVEASGSVVSGAFSSWFKGAPCLEEEVSADGMERVSQWAGWGRQSLSRGACPAVLLWPSSPYFGFDDSLPFSLFSFVRTRWAWRFVLFMTVSFCTSGVSSGPVAPRSSSLVSFFEKPVSPFLVKLFFQ